jgi:tetratricopeptide (TPR) repeat protein
MSKKNKAGHSARPSRNEARTDLEVPALQQDHAIDDNHQAQIIATPGWRNIYALIPVVIAIIASFNTLWNEFAADDSLQILRNALIRNISNLPLTFTTSVWSYATEDIIVSIDYYYRPIFMALLTLNYSIFGTTAWAWHLVNVATHAGVTFLLFITFREATERTWTAALTAALFAVHPTHAESVAWLSGITDPLMSLFLLPAFYFYLRYRKTKRNIMMAAAVLFYFLALLSKETALALPLIVAYCEMFYFKDETPFNKRFSRALVLGSLFILPTMIYFAMRYFALSSIVFGTEPRYPISATTATIPIALTKYLGLLSIPAGYSYQHYTELVTSLTLMRFWLPLALIALICIAVILSKSRVLGLAATWFIVTLAPALVALRQFDLEFLIQERYLYIPSMGFCLAVACGIQWIAERNILGIRGKAVAATLTVIIIGTWGTAYFKHNRAWYDTISIFENSAAVEPNSPLAHTALAKAYFESGRPKQAEEQARIALSLDDKNVDSYLSLSYLAHLSGMTDKAIEYLEQGTSAVEESSINRYKRATMALNLGLLYAQRRDFDLAEASLKRSIEVWPRATGWYYLGQFYFDRGRYEEAKELFELTRDNVSKNFAPIHFKLGQVYESLYQKPQARAAYQKYLQLASPISKDRDVAIRRLREL